MKLIGFHKEQALNKIVWTILLNVFRYLSFLEEVLKIDYLALLQINFKKDFTFCIQDDTDSINIRSLHIKNDKKQILYESDSIHEYQNERGVSIMITLSQKTVWLLFLRTLTWLSIPHVRLLPHKFTSLANTLL